TAARYVGPRRRGRCADDPDNAFHGTDRGTDDDTDDDAGEHTDDTAADWVHRSGAAPRELRARDGDVELRPLAVDLQEPGKDRLRAIFTSALVSEIRKLDGVSVVGMDEVRA